MDSRVSSLHEVLCLCVGGVFTPERKVAPLIGHLRQHIWCFNSHRIHLLVLSWVFLGSGNTLEIAAHSVCRCDLHNYRKHTG